MKNLFTRYGGSLLVMGQGKASEKDLPKDQSLDNMLENHSTEIIKNIIYCSSYDMVPEYMGPYEYLAKGAVKLGDVTHEFHEILFQQTIVVTTSIYIAQHTYNNVFSIFIKTPCSQLKDFIGESYDSYDYVLTMFFRGIGGEGLLKKQPELLEKILLVLFFKMELQFGFIEFMPSKTYLGKRLSKEFISSLKEALEGITKEEELSEYLKSKYNK